MKPEERKKQKNLRKKYKKITGHKETLERKKLYYIRKSFVVFSVDMVLTYESGETWKKLKKT